MFQFENKMIQVPDTPPRLRASASKTKLVAPNARAKYFVDKKKEPPK